MARKYCLEYGVLEQHEASKLLKETGKNKKWCKHIKQNIQKYHLVSQINFDFKL